MADENPRLGFRVCTRPALLWCGWWGYLRFGRIDMKRFKIEHL